MVSVTSAAAAGRDILGTWRGRSGSDVVAQAASGNGTSHRSCSPAGQTRINAGPSFYRSGWTQPPRLNFAEADACSNPVAAPGSAPSSLPSSARGSTFSRASNTAMATASTASRLLRRGSREDGAESDAGSDGASSIASTAICGGSASVRCNVQDFAVVSTAGPRHEGWLSKRTSAKVAARWQRRYFVLEGFRLCYRHQAGVGTAERAFDLRRVRRLEIIAARSRELQLDYGHRVWRLRADSAEAARRWLLLLEAARLVAGPQSIDDDDGGSLEDAGSDDDSASSCSTVESTYSFLPGETAFPAGKSGSNLACPSTVADALEVDPDELDRRFESWFACGPESHIEGSSSGGAATASAGCPLRAAEAALVALWEALGSSNNDEGAMTGAQGALSALKRHPRSDATAVGEAVECVLAEYISRISRSLKRWVEEDDPCAKEVRDLAAWLLFDARPALEHLEAGVIEFAASSPVNWRVAADSAERFLLNEWEARSCDELSLKCEVSYKASASFEAATQSKARVESILGLLQSAASQVSFWRGHPTACDRATSVLIATLNGVLRGYRIHLRMLLAPVVAAQARGEGISDRGGTRRRLTKVLLLLGSRIVLPSKLSIAEHDHSIITSRVDFSAAIIEAATFAEFCADQAKTAPNITADPSHQGDSVAVIRASILAAFAGAFEQEAAELCTVLVEVYFTATTARELETIAFDSRAFQRRCMSQSDSSTEPDLCSGACAESCVAAQRFLDEMFSSAPPLCGRLCSYRLAQLLSRRWVRAFRRHPPRLSLCGPGLILAIQADEAVLERLCSRWGANVAHGSLGADPFQALREVRSMLSEPAPELLSIGVARLELALGAEHGIALGNAVRYAASH